MFVARFSLSPRGGSESVHVDREVLDTIFEQMEPLGWNNLSLTLQSDYFLRQVKSYSGLSLKGMFQLYRLHRLATKAMATWDNLFTTFVDPADEDRVRNGYTDEQLNALVVAASNRLM